MSGKSGLTEAEVCQNFITPALEQAGWEKLTQIRREYSFTAGRVIVRGKLAVRGRQKRADYLLFYQANLPLAVVEAKDNSQSVGAGMPQALAYAEALDVPFVFSSNGDGFLFHDRTGLSNPVEQVLRLEEFPSPAELWKRYREWKGLADDAERVARQPYYDDPNGKEPRYYQRIAVQRTIEAIAAGQRRVLLLMATGTGKTLTIFQIIWRLWKAGTVNRVLFLVDRNNLADQTMKNDFKAFGSVMTKVKNRSVDPSYEVYLALYQAVTGTEEEDDIFKSFSPDFFDLVVIDECHRGSAREDSAWRRILEYFDDAIQVGLTATPKETEEVSTLTYFGDPVYEYSLKQGIEDGFLAPYKVVRIDLDKDVNGWRPTKGMTDDHGQTIEDRVYNQRDMDRSLILTQRTERVAEKVLSYMLGTDPYGKAIVFCENIDHAERMRSALANEVARVIPEEASNTAKFIVRITGDNDEGKGQLDNFIDPEKRYPVIATTSKLLTTGVDAKTCKLIVLDQRIQSMIEFKQIVGRGTRIHEDAGKLWFTIIDFKKATELFADPKFDGQPVVIYQPGPGEPVVPPEDEPESTGREPPDGNPDSPEESTDEDDLDAGVEFPPPIVDPPPGGGGVGPNPLPTRYVVSGVTVTVVAERVQYYGSDGKLITESLTDYTRDAVKEQFASLSDFHRYWSAADRKAVVIDELRERGVLFEALREQVGRELDPFDLICHVVYDRPPLTRRERAEAVRKRDVFTNYGADARAVLDALLDKYADEGLAPVEDPGVLRVQPLSTLGTPVQLVKHFGGREGYQSAIRELEHAIYEAVA
jgi:type I restriction enzyme R subunit